MINLICQRHGNGDGLLRHGIARARRAVMRGNRFRHAGILTLAERIIPPHYALQFGKFTHHAGRKIRLRQARAAPR